MKRINRVTVLREIPIRNLEEPMPATSRIIIDKSYPVGRREHQVIHQQGKEYGTVGDRCYYISQQELLELEKSNVIIIQ